MINAEDTLYFAERTLNTLIGWKDGFTCGARLKEEPPVLVKALNSIARNTCCDKCQDAALVARDALQNLSEDLR